MEAEPLTLLCLAHLPWDHVWQRPQQLMSRFTRRCRVIYVDPPRLDALVPAGEKLDGSSQAPDQGETGKGRPRPYLPEMREEAGVQILSPVFPTRLLDTPGNSYPEMWLQLLPEVLAQAGSNTILWVFSPLADYLVAVALPYVKLAIYDCMDDLASFKDGTDEMRRREGHLLELADMLFTGGYSMYVARKDRHPRAYCFPSGVDVAHYRQVDDPATVESPVIAPIPRPRLGYFGVLDERIDWDMIAGVAEQRPDWHWALVGPTAKVDPAELPVAPNIHYLGQQSYGELPALLKGFDVATMPFALNQATRFISPTKTLEYLAGGKAVISTSVPDVVAFYRDIVYLADGPAAWVGALEELLASTPEQRRVRLERAAPILEKTSWDSITERMWALIQERLAEKHVEEAEPAGRPGSSD